MKKRYLLIRPPLEEAYPELPNFRDRMLYKYMVFEKTVEVCLPYGLLKIGAYLKAQDHEVKLLDFGPHSWDSNEISLHKYGTRKTGNRKKEYQIFLIGNNMEEIKDILLKEKEPDEIFITSSMTFHAKSVAEVTNLCKEIFPKAKVVVGGIYASLCAEHTKKNTLADHIHKGPIWEADKYRSDISLLDYKPDYYIFKSTRGCPFNCSYCAVHFFEGRKVHTRNYQDVLDEIFYVNEKYGIKQFKAWESNILINFKEHFERILDGIIESGRDIIFGLPEGIAPQLLTPELAKKLYNAGLESIDIPLESSDEDMNKDRFHRVAKMRDFENSIKYLLDGGFNNKDIWCFVLVGMPKQALKSQIDSLWTVWQNKVRPLFMFFTPIPQTEEYQKHEELIRGRELGELHPYLFPFADGKYFTVEDMEDLLCIQVTMYPLERLHYLPSNSRVRKEILSNLAKDPDVRKYNYQLMLYEYFMRYEMEAIKNLSKQQGEFTIISFYTGNYEKFRQHYNPPEILDMVIKTHNELKNIVENSKLNIKGLSDNDNSPLVIDLFSFLYMDEKEITNTLKQNQSKNLTIRVWNKEAAVKFSNFFPEGFIDEDGNSIPVCNDADWWKEELKKLGYKVNNIVSDSIFTGFDLEKKEANEPAPDNAIVNINFT